MTPNRTRLFRPSLTSIRQRIHWPRSRETRLEMALIGIPLAVFLLFLLPALAYAQREYRDGLRRERLRETKVLLEQWNNAHGAFPLHPSSDLGWCGSTADPEDWFFTDIVVRELGKASVRDPRHTLGSELRYCPTAIAPREDAAPLAAGFYLDATLENPNPERTTFNREYNFFERVALLEGKTHYRLCGGSETQCGAPRASPENRSDSHESSQGLPAERNPAPGARTSASEKGSLVRDGTDTWNNT